MLFNFEVIIYDLTVGVHNHEDPPVPIPNTVVKLMCAENTWLVTTRKDKSMPTPVTVLTVTGYTYTISSVGRATDS